MEELIYKLALSYNPYIGPKRYNQIVTTIGLKDFFSLPTEKKMSFLKIKIEKAKSVFKNMLFEGEKIYRICENENIKIIEIESPLYPPQLKKIEDAPFLLYFLGNFNYSMKLLAIVGTREATEEAKRINEYFTAELVSYGIGIVSGLARGHDSISQRVALENDGYTVAVVGGGVDVIYPIENTALYNQIKQKGCIVSEYPPGSYPLKQNFPLRNRIISGLSCGVFVVQAPEKSGALITAKYAEAQGREIYTIPGNVLDPSYSGTNKLIQKGARVVVTPEEIAIDILGKNSRKKEKVNIEEKASLSLEEKEVLGFIQKVIHFDEIAAKAKIQPARLIHILTMLEIKGYISEYPGNFYSLK
ncbi:MAG: DNA-processing protein DprA [Brevinematia bacterium]